ncbi:unnamed protein product [Heligmosomoides polygyrus]|uniref:Lipoyl-binding domain-containing protein n=1 Tax=Heligmosomoides polygyrus TaxID=6339 RepID=A0A183G8T3_HELPZ|nr:unnamed protein product [Heligmosomoides polygyrus]
MNPSLPVSVGDVIVVEGPAFAESISEGDIRWIKQKGDFVKEDELVAEIETDKTSVEVPAPQSGTIVELLVEDGAKVTAKQKLYKLELGSAGASAAAAAPAPKAEPPKEAEKPAPRPPAAADAASTPVPSPPSPPPPPPTTSVHGKCSRLFYGFNKGRVSASHGPLKESNVRVKMNRMRLRIAARLKDAQNTYAMLTTFNEIDMRCVLEHNF